MPMPMIVRSHFEMLETEIRSADPMTSRVLRHNSETHVRNIRAYADITPEADRALTQALIKIAALAEGYRQFGMMGSASQGAIEGFRQQALHATAILRPVLEQAELNERGRALFG